jgi:hypothetical protein
MAKAVLNIDSNSWSNLFDSTKKIDSAQCRIARSQFSLSNLIEYLREFESTGICKTVLDNESMDPGVQLNEKNRGSKIS